MTDRLQLGAGIGLSYVDRDWNTDRITGITYVLPVFGSYSFGKKKSHLITEFGATLGVSTNFKTYSYKEGIIPFVSLGYEYKGDKMVYRIPVYIIYVGENDFAPALVPWIGISAGRLI